MFLFISPVAEQTYIPLLPLFSSSLALLPPKTPIIKITNIINTKKGARFSIVHELSHHILHQGINTPFLKRNTLFSIDKIEREANELALYILIGNNKPEYGETKNASYYVVVYQKSFMFFINQRWFVKVESV
ncbi:ImmA/IrrE family metallo-endopeptidase [Paenibacillus larvae]